MFYIDIADINYRLEELRTKLAAENIRAAIDARRGNQPVYPRYSLLGTETFRVLTMWQVTASNSLVLFPSREEAERIAGRLAQGERWDDMVR